MKRIGLVAQVDARAAQDRQRYSSVAWERILSDLDRNGRTQVELMRVLSSAVIAAISDLVDQGYLVARERSGVFIADPACVRVETPRGSVRAKQAVIATNAYTDAVDFAPGRLDRRIVAINTSVIAMSDNRFAPIPFHAFRIPGMQIVASWYRHLDAKAIRGERSAA